MASNLLHFYNSLCGENKLDVLIGDFDKQADLLDGTKNGARIRTTFAAVVALPLLALLPA